MKLHNLLIKLDRATRAFDRIALGDLRRLGRRALGSSLVRHLEVEVDGLAVAGTIQHRAYLHRLVAGTAEPFTTQLLVEQFRPGVRFVDIGAFLGIYTLRAARGGARVISVEANPETRALLLSNLRRNDLENEVEVVAAAVAAEDGTADYFAGEGDQSASGLAPTRSNRRRLAVETRRLDGLVDAADVVKIDVEGAEEQVLDGMAGLLDAGHPLTLVVECNPAGLARLGSSPRRLLDRLLDAGFKVKAIDEVERRLVPAETALDGTSDFVNLYSVR